MQSIYYLKSRDFSVYPSLKEKHSLKLPSTKSFSSYLHPVYQKKVTMKLSTASLLMLMTLFLPRAHGGVMHLDYRRSNKRESQQLSDAQLSASKLHKRVLVKPCGPAPNGTASRSVPPEKRAAELVNGLKASNAGIAKKRLSCI
jgi:hypothetical protein